MVIATNGYTGDVTPTLKRRLVPVASHIIATEELPEDLVKSLIPKGRVVSDTKRVLCYYRRSPDDKRVIFGGRARFTQVTPEVSAPARSVRAPGAAARSAAARPSFARARGACRCR